MTSQLPVLFSAFCAALASVLLGIVFSNEPLFCEELSAFATCKTSRTGESEFVVDSLQISLHWLQIFEWFTRTVLLVAGIFANISMLRFFVSANVLNESSTQVGAGQLGLNCIFSVLLAKIFKPRAIASMLFVIDAVNSISVPSHISSRMEAAAKIDYESLPDKQWVVGVGLILCGVGLLNKSSTVKDVERKID